MDQEFSPTIDSAPSQSSREKDVSVLATGAGINLIGRISGRGLYAVTEVVLARLLGPADFGLFSIGLNILRIVGIFGTLGLQNGVIRFGARYWQSSPGDLKGTILRSIGIAFSSGTILGGILYLIAPWLAVDAFKKPELILVFKGLAFAFPFVIGIWVASAATRISKRMKYSVIAEDFAQPAINLALVTVFFFIGLTLAWAVLLHVISQVITFLIAIGFVWLLYSGALTSGARSSIRSTELLVYSIPTGLAGSFTVITAWIGRLFVGYYRTAAEAGIYQSASQVTIFFVLILSSLNAIFSPMIADLFHRKEIDRIEELYRVSTKWGLYLVTPVFLLICFVPQEFMTVIFGRAYSSGAVPLVILSAAQMINVGTGAVGFLLTMSGNQNRWFVISSLSLALNFVLNMLLVPQFGMAGAATVTAIAVGGLFLAGMLQVRRTLGLWPYDRRYLKGILASLLVIGIFYFANNWIRFYSPLVQVIAYAMASVGIFGGILLALGLDAEDRQFIRVITARVSALRPNPPGTK